eukprot:g2813.t1
MQTYPIESQFLDAPKPVGLLEAGALDAAVGAAIAPGELQLSYEGQSAVIRWCVDLRRLCSQYRYGLSRRFVVRFTDEVPFVLFLNPATSASAFTPSDLRATMQVKCTEPCKEGRTSPWDWEMHGTRLDSDDMPRLRLLFALEGQNASAVEDHDFLVEPLCAAQGSWHLGDALAVLRVEVPAAPSTAKGLGKGQGPSEGAPSQVVSQIPCAAEVPAPDLSEGSWTPEVRSALWSMSSSGSRRERREPSSRHSRTTTPRGQLAPHGPSACAARNAGAPSAPEVSAQVHPPWGVERANQDRPDLLLQKRLEYRQVLDEQSAKMADLHRRQRAEQVELEKNSIPSLATKTHEWEKHTEGDWKALMEDEIQMERWLRRRSGSTSHHLTGCEEDCELTQEWMKVSEEKKRLKEKTRKEELKSEQKALQALREGLAPPRRLRKPVSLCDYYTEPVSPPTWNATSHRFEANTFSQNRLPFGIQSPMVLVLDAKSLEEGQIIGVLQEGDLIGASLVEHPWVMLPENSFVRHPKMRQGRIKLLRPGWVMSQHPQYGDLLHAVSMDQVRKLFAEEAFAKLPMVKEAAQTSHGGSWADAQLPTTYDMWISLDKFG